MVARFRIVTAALALTVTSAVVGCGALIGIEDGVPDPGTSAADATTVPDSPMTMTAETGARDASTDTSAMPDVVAAPGPMGRPGGTTTSLPCGGATCAIPGQSCCSYRASGQQGVFSGVCETSCAPPGGSTDMLGVLKCSGPFNCPQATPRCCVSTVSQSQVATACKTGCDPQAGEFQLCDPDANNTCSWQRSCVHFVGNTMPPSWGYCM